HKLTPYTKLIYTLWAMVTAFALFDIMSLLTYLCFSLVFWYLAKIPDIIQRFRIVILAASGTAMMYLVAQGFFFFRNETPLFTLFQFYVVNRVYGTFYLEGFLYGLAMGLKIIVVIAIVPVLTLTTSIPDLVVAMDKMKVPYKFNFAFATAFRFSPLILSSISVIQEAQRLRAHNIDKMGYIDKIRKAYVPIVTPLFISLLRRSDELEIAIESRGFGAPVKRTFVNEIRFTWRDYVLLAFIVVMTIITIYQVFLTGNGSLYPVQLLPEWLRPQR
ncbi:MAG: energy-coupling factor transporter transmembrane component T family protein, partial [Candidatus Ranarchaeia archaeon]